MSAKGRIASLRSAGEERAVSWSADVPWAPLNQFRVVLRNSCEVLFRCTGIRVALFKNLVGLVPTASLSRSEEPERVRRGHGALLEFEFEQLL
jgi:hypothetical protein